MYGHQLEMLKREELIKEGKKMNYQQKAKQFAVYDNNLYPFLALAEEAGEVAAIAAKSVRAGNGDRWGLSEEDIDVCKLADELGDVLWNVAMICEEFDLDMREVMEENIAKLTVRKAKKEILERGK